MSSLDEVSFKIGSIDAKIDAVKEDTGEIREQIKNISGRVLKLETKAQFQSGVAATSKKYIAMISAGAGVIGAAALKLISWLFHLGG